MRSLLVEAQREDDYSGFLHVRIEPSNQVIPGIYISVNDHFQISTSETDVADPWGGLHTGGPMGCDPPKGSCDR